MNHDHIRWLSLSDLSVPCVQTLWEDSVIYLGLIVLLIRRYSFIAFSSQRSLRSLPHCIICSLWLPSLIGCSLLKADAPAAVVIADPTTATTTSEMQRSKHPISSKAAKIIHRHRYADIWFVCIAWLDLLPPPQRVQQRRKFHFWMNGWVLLQDLHWPLLAPWGFPERPLIQ